MADEVLVEHGARRLICELSLEIQEVDADFRNRRHLRPGLARLVRSAVTPAMENVALWHERDISHSSVERGIGPDATIHLDFALRRLAMVMERLVIYPENMLKNLDRLGGLVHSQRVLLALTQKGMSREDAYAAVQSNAMRVWRGEGSFLPDFAGAGAGAFRTRSRSPVASSVARSSCSADRRRSIAARNSASSPLRGGPSGKTPERW